MNEYASHSDCNGYIVEALLMAISKRMIRILSVVTVFVMSSFAASAQIQHPDSCNHSHICCDMKCPCCPENWSGQFNPGIYSEAQIDEHVKYIDELKAQNGLVKISYPNRSACGGGLDGYYLDKKLVLIEATYQGELGFSSKTIYLDGVFFLKIIYREHFAEWGKYEQNFPPDKFEWDPGKMTYTDTVYSLLFSTPGVFQKKSNNQIISTRVEKPLIDRLVQCGSEMRLELQEVTDLVDSLKFVKEMPYVCEEIYDINKRLSYSMGCGDQVYWNVVKLNGNAIELLIDQLDDSSTTESLVPLFGYYYTTADIAYSALQEIIHKIPTFELLGIEFDKDGCGYCSYWQHLNKSHENRKEFKAAVWQWYHSNKDNFIWIENNSFETCLCYGEHPNGGHYELKINKQ